MRRSLTIPLLALCSTAGVACGPPLQSKPDAAHTIAGACVPTTAARTPGADLGLHASVGDSPEQLPEPSITVQGVDGEAVLSVNPVGLVVGLAGKGLLFDAEFKGYSIDGVNSLDGKVSVLANFDYLAALNEDPRANFEVSLVGEVDVNGAFHDSARLNLKVTSNLGDLMTHDGTTKLRLQGKITASEQDFLFDDEDVEIDWKAL